MSKVEESEGNEEKGQKLEDGVSLWRRAQLRSVDVSGVQASNC